MNLYAIPRRGHTATQINVGHMQAGGQRNVICDRADLELEVRGETTEANDYMEEGARRVIKNAAEMYGCGYDINIVGRFDENVMAAGIKTFGGLVYRLLGS